MYNIKIELSKAEAEKLESCENLETQKHYLYKIVDFLNGYIDPNDISEMDFGRSFGIDYVTIKIRSGTDE